MTKLNSGFTKDNEDDLFRLAGTIVTNVGNIPVFAGLKTTLPAITTAAEALHTALAMPYGPARDVNIITSRAALIGLLQHLAEACMGTTNVKDTDLAATGFPLRHAATHTSAPPDAPDNVRLKTTGISGHLQIMLSAVPRAAFYEAEWTFDPVNGSWTAVPAFNSTRGMFLDGLTRGKDVFVHVRAVAAGQNRGPWSTIANAMAM